ncbi:cobaltochelatase CobT-related protein [Oceanisphaera psychrotolerans]|uniref:Cobalamin biosynthesis protein CobT n=1 Tax=Oceanisphaera psychrotolerans TaxID=1414654 RepID=A0A1J4Q8X3_9GAMM|nr:cobalamin biosynthesis protein CobT [Oceanisphaera psychrotolerans]OIN03801.1 cobalamin biosynthesis protein CobT [Oceanisphaera psychrotolerans]
MTKPHTTPGTPDSDQAQQERRQQRLEELSAALIRALSDQHALRYRGHRLEWQGRPYPLRAPHLHPQQGLDDLGSFRGVADAIALRLRHNDADLHRQWLPTPPVARLIFELLEQLRVESLVESWHPGSRHNLHHRFEAWSNQFQASGQTESHIGLLLFTLAQMSWVQLGGGPLDEPTEMMIESTRMFLLREIGPAFGLIRRHRHDQAAFAEQALSIALCMNELIDDLGQRQGADGKQEDALTEDTKRAFGLLLDLDGGDEAGLLSAEQAYNNRLREAADNLDYRVYDRGFDREWPAHKRVRPELLTRLREGLDNRIREQGLNLNVLTKKLRQLLARPQRQGWRFGEEEGQLDGRRLSTLVTSIADRRVFKQDKLEPKGDAVVTFLIDNSGSMRNHIESISMLVDTLARALERVGARVEILGFTTGHWNGGQPLKRWQRQGRPANPGRLNERCHLIYKDADTPWRRARRDIAALLKDDLFREGLDGEALQWAEQRLLAQQARDRLLLVISDGCPMDTATRQCNEQDILDLHLRQVSGRLEREGRIALCALGVGLDLSDYYRHSQLLDLSRSLDNKVFDEVLALIGKSMRD